MSPPTSSCAYQVRILDPEMQRYLQKYPFANGPDWERNRAARVAIKAGLQQSAALSGAQLIKLHARETVLPPGPAERLRQMFSELGIAKATQAGLVNDFGWKAKLVPPASSSVLAIGCGDGTELLFLRAFLPAARIMALDYGDSVSEQRKRLIGMDFKSGDMHGHLANLAPDYDLIFSNHTLEHLYTPEKTLATLCGLLSPGGALVSALPMDGNPGTPFLDLTQRFTAATNVHPLDYVFLDAGHPWKTNPGNLDATLHQAGFAQVRLYQRATHQTRITGSARGMLPLRQAFMVCGNRIFFGSARSILKALYPSRVPERLVKALFAVERRTPFGANKVKARYTHEVVAVATRDL